MRKRTTRPTSIRLLRRVVFTALAVPTLVGTVGTVQEVPVVRAADHERQTLIAQLVVMRTTRVYSDYWSCAPLVFSSRERIICSVLDEHLRPGMDRYLPYRNLVAAEARPSYVFPEGSPQSILIGRLTQGCDRQWRHLQGYTVVRPSPDNASCHRGPIVRWP